jgi:uncharacterized protein YndB with AHSA1/START domain
MKVPMSFAFTVSGVIPASPKDIYDAWLSADGHAKMTGTKTANISAAVGGKFTVWDGFIMGTNLELESHKRIIQSWRTTKFSHADLDSKIEVTLTGEGDGTRVTIRHTDVPDGHTSYRDGGWQENYFDPMKVYFAQRKLLPIVPSASC